MNESQTSITIDWEPQERQLAFLKACGLSYPFDVNLTLRPSGSKGEPLAPAVADVIGYGGAAGGGKTDSQIMIGTVGCLAYAGLNVAYFRREFPQLEGVGGAIQRSAILLSGLAKYNEQKKRWLFPNSSLLQFYHCKDPKDVYNYQSQQFDILLIDEGTQFTVEMIDYLITRNRKTINDPRFKPFTALTSNPGNVGHGFFKTRFVKLGEPEKVHTFTYEETEVQRTHIFIPSKLEDNKILTDRDPTYKDRLSTTTVNKRMLLEGDWDIIAGQFFDIWRTSLHTCRPFIPKSTLPKIGGIDYGRTKPFAFEGSAVQAVKYEDITFNRIWTYSECYATKLNLTQQAKLIKGAVNLGEYNFIRYDPSMAKEKEDGRPMIDDYKDVFGDFAYILKPADNDRISGWALMYNWLSIAPDGKPYWIIAENCINLIRTLPELIHDLLKPEDVNSDGEDHAPDAARYMLKHIKWIDGRVGGVGGAKKPKPTPTVNMTKEGKEIMIDTDKFATAFRKRR